VKSLFLSDKIRDKAQDTVNAIEANSSYIVNRRAVLTLWRPMLPYGYSYKASSARPG